MHAPCNECGSLDDNLCSTNLPDSATKLIVVKNVKEWLLFGHFDGLFKVIGC